MSRAARNVSSLGHKMKAETMCNSDLGETSPKDACGILHLSVLLKRQESMGHVNILWGDFPVLSSHEG